MTSPSSATAICSPDSEPHGRQHEVRAAKRRKRAPGPSREVGLMRDAQPDGSATFLGSSSGVYFIRTVYNAFARRSADLYEARITSKSMVPGEDDELRRNSGRSYEFDELWSADEISFEAQNLSFEELVNWSRGYFENWHPMFPFLHAPSVLNVMEKISVHGVESVDRLDLIIVRSILSMSLADNRQIKVSGASKGEMPANLVCRTVHDSMEAIRALCVEPTTLKLLQASFSVQLLLASLLRLNCASRIGGMMTRSAFHLGLHRCPSRFTCFTAHDNCVRRRLFWSIYSLDRYLSQALGVPPNIQDDDIDVCYPCAERHEDANENAHQEEGNRLRLLRHLAKFARLRGLILELRNKSILHSHGDSLDAARVNAELAEWWNEVYDDVNPIDDQMDMEAEQGSLLKPYHRLLLTALRHESVISMNRPLLVSDRLSVEYKNALQTCIESSRSLLAALHEYMRHIQKPEAREANFETFGAPLSWPSFTWATWMACLIVMYAASEGDFPKPSALKCAKLGVSILQHFSLRQSSWPETCIEAIRGMESALATDPATGTNRQRHQPVPSAEPENRQPGSVQSSRHDLPAHGGTPRGTYPSDPGRRTPDPENFFTSAQLANIRTPPSPAREQIHEFERLSTQHPRPSGQARDSSTHATPNTHVTGDYPYLTDPAQDMLSFGGNDPAGLVFGDIAGTNTFQYSAFPGADAPPFVNTDSFATNNLWSVADGPWMIHENFS